MKRTPFFNCYKGAKLIEYNGWELPVQFEKTMLEEHIHVREEVGLFDVSHMGEIIVKGRDRVAFLNRLLTNRIENTEVGQVQYNLMCSELGTTLDDLLVYCFSTHYLLVVNAGNIEKDFEWILKHSKEYSVEVENISENIAQLALQGPKSQTIIEEVFGLEGANLGFFKCVELQFEGVELLLSRTGYTGEDGFEIYVDRSRAERVWETLFQAKSSSTLAPIGLGARDTLRVEAALPLYGHELTHENCAYEVPMLRFAIKLEKDFIGREALLTFSNNCTTHLIGLETEEKIIPREGMEILNSKEECVGRFTSGCFSPTLSKTVAMARVESEKVTGEEAFYLRRGKKLVPLKVTAMPFFRKKYKR